MNTVSKNIKRLRMRDNISQEVLSEKLYVSRQAISNWETGKTQPDIDTLVAIAAAFNVDVSEVIYGVSIKPEAYPQDKKKRIIATCVFGFIVLIFILLEIIFVPHFKRLAITSYNVYPIVYITFYLRPLFYINTSLFFFSALSLRYDIRIKKTLTRKVILYSSSIFIIFYFLNSVNSFLGIVPNSAFLLYRFVVPLMTNAALFVIPGTGLFFGFNK